MIPPKPNTPQMIPAPLPQSLAATVHGICHQDPSLLLFYPTRYSGAGPPAGPPPGSSITAGTTTQHKSPGCQERLSGCATWGLPLVGTTGNTISCVPRLVTRIAGSARTYEATRSVTDLCHRDRDLQDPHLPGAHLGVPVTPAPRRRLPLAIARNLHRL